VGADDIRRRLSRITGKKVVLTVTDNRTSMLYISPGPNGSVKVRLHHMFLLATPEVIKALAQYIRRPNRSTSATLNLFIREHRYLIGGRPRGRAYLNLTHRGFHFNLKEIYDRLNEDYFESRLKVPITWGRGRTRARRQSIDFGCFDLSSRIIRINPALDRPWVPRIFIDFIVYHEMLHGSLGIRSLGNGRSEIHSMRFREEEKAFRFYKWALKWERSNLWRFLRAT
jgi:hypothetical protein